MHEIFTAENVPDYPDSVTAWRTLLRWLVCVMNDSDPSLQFIASVLAQSIKNDGISAKQAASSRRVLKRVYGAWDEGLLDCQFDPDDDGSECHDIDHLIKDKPPWRLN